MKVVLTETAALAADSGYVYHSTVLFVTWLTSAPQLTAVPRSARAVDTRLAAVRLALLEGRMLRVQSKVITMYSIGRRA